MKRILALVFLAAFLSSTTGCIIHTHPSHRSKKKKVIKPKKCAPSHYWDGEKCRRGIEIASDYAERFRRMSPWKRRLFDAAVWLLTR